jgi:glycosyltransferase involved in cell wall biosynthesis
MIVRDEEHCIESMLSASRPHVGEIVIVDTGSIDRTVLIAERFADRLEHFEWIDDFSAARNYSLSLATLPWILVLDADEVVSPEGFAELYQLLKSPLKDGFYMTQHLYQNNQEEGDLIWKPVVAKTFYTKDYRGYRDNQILRLFRNRVDICYRGRIHEIVDSSIPKERIGSSNVVIHHYHEDPENPSDMHSLRDLEILEDMIISDAATAREYLNAGAVHLRTTKNFNKASQYLLKSLELGAEAGDALEALAEAHYRNGELQKAMNLYEELYKSGHGSTAVLNNLSNLRIKAGDLIGSEKLLEELLKIGINDPLRKMRIQQNLEAVRSAIRDDSEAID